MTKRGEGLPETSRGGWRLAFRMSRRMAQQSVGRSVLVAVLIAVPIFGVAGIDTVQASRQATPSESVRLQLGQNQAMVQVVSGPGSGLEQDPVDPFSTSGSIDTPVTISSPAEVLPPGTRILPVLATSVVVRTVTGIANVSAVEGPVWNRAFAGRDDVVTGRSPTTDDEVMVSPGGVKRFGVAVGGTLRVTQPSPHTYTVVGVLENASSPADDAVVYGRTGAFATVKPSEAVSQTEYYLPDLRLDWPQVQALNAKGLTVLSRAVVLDPPTDASISSSTGGDSLLGLFVVLLAAFGLFEVCLLAGAAFAVGARRRQRALAILSSVGADRRTLFGIMSFEGVILGALGGLLGTALGIAGAAIAAPILAGGDQSRYPGFHVDPLALGATVLAATLAGWISAAIPARAASRVDIVVALRGAQRPTASTLRRPLVGVFIAAAGSVIALAGGLVIISSQNLEVNGQNRVLTLGIVLLAAGPVIMQIGALLTAPLLLRWTARGLSRLGTAARLGARDASRNSGRTVPAVAAIMSCVFVSAFALCMLAGGQKLTVDTYSWTVPDNTAVVNLTGYSDAQGRSFLVQPDGIAAALAKSYPGSQAVVLSGALDAGLVGDSVSTYTVPRLVTTKGLTESYQQSSTGTGHLIAGDLDDLAVMLGEPANATSRATLAAGGAVSLYPQYLHDGRVTIDTVTSASLTADDPGKPVRSQSLAATVQSASVPTDFGIFVTTATADRLGIPIHPTAVVAALDHAPTAAEDDAARAAVSVANPIVFPYVETGPPRFAALWSWPLLAVTTLIALVSAAVALALARADARRDDEVLVAVGAPPRLQRAFGFWQAIVITGLGSVIGVALGLVPAAALSVHGVDGSAGYVPFVPPWLLLGLTAIGIPLVIAGGSWLALRRPRGLWTVRRLPAV